MELKLGALTIPIQTTIIVIAFVGSVTASWYATKSDARDLQTIVNLHYDEFKSTLATGARDRAELRDDIQRSNDQIRSDIKELRDEVLRNRATNNGRSSSR